MAANVALVFPGQGSQRIGMLESMPNVAQAFMLLEAAESLTGLPLRQIAATGDMSQLADTRVAQPLLYVVDWAWGHTLLEAGLAPTVTAGHSLGELAALAVAGVFPVETGMELVIERSQLMARAAQDHPGSMTAVIGMDAAGVSAAIDGLEDVWLANDNAPGQIVLSGTTDALAAAEDALRQAGARRLVPLSVAGPFHSPLMSVASSAFAAILDETAFADARIPVVQNADPTAATDGALIRQRLKAQMTSPVRWTETLATLSASAVGVLVEAGPGSVLTGLVKRIEGLSALSVDELGVHGVLEEVA